MEHYDQEAALDKRAHLTCEVAIARDQYDDPARTAHRAVTQNLMILLMYTGGTRLQHKHLRTTCSIYTGI